MAKSYLSVVFALVAQLCFCQQIDYENSIRYSASIVGEDIYLQWPVEANTTTYSIKKRTKGTTSYNFLAIRPEVLPDFWILP